MFDFAETGATIKDLTLEGSLPGDAYCGAYAAAFVLAVESPLGLTLDNCHFNGSVTNVYHSAALVGFASPGADYEGRPSIILNNCSANANITTTRNYIAGGLVAKGTGVEAYDCSFKGKVTSLGTVGGLIGEAINCKLENCFEGGYTYIDKNSNNVYSTDYTVLDNTMTTLAGGWYVVNSDVTFSGKLSTNASGDVHIILCDGATLTAKNIVFDHSNHLYIYGQSHGTGTASISYIEAANSLQIYGGIINAAGNITSPTGSVGIYGGNVTAAQISGKYNLTFTGGTITAGSLTADEGSIKLGGATVKANSYSAHNGVTITNGITYYDGTGASYTEGNLTSGQISAIEGKTLRTYDYRSGTCGKDDPATGDVDESQNVTWMLTGNTLTISGTGAMADYADANYQPWAANRLVINTIVINEGVTSIGKYAFSNFEEATSVSIPASVTSIGYYSFNFCPKLSSLNIAANSSLKTIDNNAFYLCSGLESVSIPASVTSIGSSAFDCCSNLATVTLNSNPSIGEHAFDDIKAGATVTMNLTANSAGGAYWTTFYNKNYSFEADANTQVFKAALSGTALTLTELTTDKIVNKDNAVILKSTASPIVMTLTTDGSNDFTGNSLQGVDNPDGKTAADPSTTYVLNNGSNGVGFYKLTAGKTLGVGKAYLTYPSSSAPEYFGFDEDATAIISIENGKLKIENEADEVYDLQGRRVAQPTKGMYIVNGKKVIIK